MELAFPQFASYEKRLASYVDGQTLAADSFAPLARDEFFYDNDHLTSVCFHCGDQEDSPNLSRLMHMRNNARCVRIRDLWEPRLIQRPIAAAVHPEYSDAVARYETFLNWPPQMKQHPALLADAGFIYSGEGDKVVCYYCDKGLCRWEKEDNPAYEHVKHFPQCPFARQVYARQTFV